MGGCALLRQKGVRDRVPPLDRNRYVPLVEIDRVRSAPQPTVHVPEQRGVSAAMADARAKLRDATPVDRWDAVLSEVSRIQMERKTSLLDAMHVVLGKLAAGWTPPA
jgi:hypothetical protein